MTTHTSCNDLAPWLARELGRGELAPVELGDMTELAQHLRCTLPAAGTVVFARGDLPTEVHIVRRGVVELTHEARGRTVTVKRLGPGDVFGDIPLLLRQSEPFTARTATDSTILSVDSTVLYGLLGRRPRLARRWLVSVADRMHETQQRVLDLLAGSLREQLASLLMHHDGPGPLRTSQAHLARELGASRTRVNQVLRGFEQEGLIELGYRCLHVLDADGLRAITGNEERALAGVGAG